MAQCERIFSMTPRRLHRSLNSCRNSESARIIRPSVRLYLALAIAALSVSAIWLAGPRASAEKSTRIDQAKLSDRVSIKAAGRGNPWINVRNGHDLITSYGDSEESRARLQGRDVEPLALASADFDEDGMPDLISGYATGGEGVITLLRGNVDAVYPNTLEALNRKAEGSFTDAPFLSPAQVIPAPVAPDFLEAGDFDADGHLDMVAAARGGNTLYLLPGDGRGGVKEVQSIHLPGNVSALKSGDINRADGMADIAVGIEGDQGFKLLVFEGPSGAIRNAPEEFTLQAAPKSLAIAYLDNDLSSDLAVAAGNQLVILYGRDRKLSEDEKAQASVEQVVISRKLMQAEIASIAIGDFTGDQKLEIALACQDGSVSLLKSATGAGRKSKAAKKPLQWEVESLATRPDSADARIYATRVSSLEHETIVVSDANNQSLRLWMDDEEQRERGTDISQVTRRDEFVNLEVEGEPVTVLPMRLNKDALSDLVVLRKGSSDPSFIITAPLRIFTVGNSADDGDENTSDNECGAGIDEDGGSEDCTLRAAIEQANASSGADEIDFGFEGSGPFVLNPASALLQINQAVTIDGASQLSPQGRPLVTLNPGSGSVNEGVRINASSTVVRGLAINRFPNRGVISLNPNNIVEGNFFGINSAGQLTQGNGTGVTLSNAGAVIGGTVQAAANFFANNGVGIDLNSANAIGSNIRGNFIGVTLTNGSFAGNAQQGVLVRSGAQLNNIGGSIPGAANFIAGNGGEGVSIQQGVGNLIQRNQIRANQRSGVLINSATNTVGGNSATTFNSIWSNGGSGVDINGGGATANLVQGNSIGVGSNNGNLVNLANTQHGVVVSGSGNTVGGTAQGAGNFIAFNGADGVSVVSGNQNLIRANSIFLSADLGIDLGNDGPTANDNLDPDGGPNDRQNFPDLVSAFLISESITTSESITPTAVTAVVTISGTINSTANTTLTVEFIFYCESACDRRSGTGDTVGCLPLPLGTRTVQTNANGQANFSFEVTTPRNTGFVNCNATNPGGSTSEFSSCIAISPNNCTYQINDTEQTFTAAGGTGTFNLTTQTGCSWTVNKSVDWITITSTTTGTGNTTVNYTVQANAADGGRTGTITVQGLTHTVTQQGLVVGPLITDAFKEGAKKLFVIGSGFEQGAVVIARGKNQVTKFESPTRLLAKKGGKKLNVGDIIQVRNPNGTLSPEFTFQ